MWTRGALTRPRPLTYWTTAVGCGGVVAAVVAGSLVRGDLLRVLITVLVWSGPLRALALPRVRRALSGGDEPRSGLRQRLAEAMDPRLRPAPLPLPA